MIGRTTLSLESLSRLKTRNYAWKRLLKLFILNLVIDWRKKAWFSQFHWWWNGRMLWNYCCKRVVWGLSGEVKMGGYYHYIGTLWSYQRGWRGHNCTCHNCPIVITHLPLSSSLSVLLTHFASHSSSSNCSFLKYFPPKFNLIFSVSVWLICQSKPIWLV